MAIVLKTNCDEECPGDNKIFIKFKYPPFDTSGGLPSIGRDTDDNLIYGYSYSKIQNIQIYLVSGDTYVLLAVTDLSCPSDIPGAPSTECWTTTPLSDSAAIGIDLPVEFAPACCRLRLRFEYDHTSEADFGMIPAIQVTSTENIDNTTKIYTPGTTASGGVLIFNAVALYPNVEHDLPFCV